MTKSTQQLRRGRRPALSVEMVLDEAIALMDADGENALTLRALAARLDTGVGSLYHYVSSRDELLDRATDRVLGELVTAVCLPDEPYVALAELSEQVYLSMKAHRWMANYLMRDTGMQPNSMRVFELFGRQVRKLELSSAMRFTVVSTLVSFVVGVGAEMRELPEAAVVEGKTQREYLHEYAESWRALDPEEFAFLHEVAGEFEAHDDVQQFRDGIELFLDGVRAQVGR